MVTLSQRNHHNLSLYKNLAYIDYKMKLSKQLAINKQYNKKKCYFKIIKHGHN